MRVLRDEEWSVFMKSRGAQEGVLGKRDLQ